MINETEMEVEDYEEVIGDLDYTVTLLALRQDKTRAHSEVFGTTPQPIFCVLENQISQLFIRSGAHKLFRRFFLLIALFDRNFEKIVAPPSDEYENYVVQLNEQSLMEKG